MAEKVSAVSAAARDATQEGGRGACLTCGSRRLPGATRGALLCPVLWRGAGASRCDAAARVTLTARTQPPPPPPPPLLLFHSFGPATPLSTGPDSPPPRRLWKATRVRRPWERICSPAPAAALRTGSVVALRPRPSPPHTASK
ncbi:uncharacterized protein LOC126179364 [Schistocerca cancellata]|uniref:uncharacterized protein LOC126179364 n=1 Tax=Schistocerca cancellata TaxID=274614 RepID=UPI002117CAF2|nr:uncharacterized protein LOC126179364 [Schistocerca cancellata]